MLGSFLVAAQMGLIAVLIWQSRAALESPWFIAGLAISGAWMLWAVWSMPHKTLKIHPSPAEAGVLCRNRAYRWVRHPMYGAVLLGGLMLAWAEGGWLTLLCWLGLILTLWVKSSLEEKWLSERYPEYEEFKRITPRWIPLWPMGNDTLPQRWGRRVLWTCLLLLLATLLWQSYEGAWDTNLFDGKSAHNIRTRQAAQLIDTTPDLLVLDVRSEWEYSGQRLPGAVNISINDPDFDDKFSHELTGKSAILIYCAGGYRSRQGVGRIQQLENTLPVYHLHRGMMEWWWR